MELVTLLTLFIIFLAIGTVLHGIFELACFRSRGHGLAANRRKQYTTTVVKVILHAGGAAVATSLVVNPVEWMALRPGFSTYAPGITFLAVVIVALIAYRLEVSSEAPASVHDLYIDLRKVWAEEEILSRHSLARHKSWLEGFKATNGGRSLTSTKRRLDPRLQKAIELSLAGNYRDVRFRRLARCATLEMVIALWQGHPWRMLWSLLPSMSSILAVGLLIIHPDLRDQIGAPRLALIAGTVLVLGVMFSALNVWTRFTARLRTYCDLKRHEELCTLVLRKLKQLSAQSGTQNKLSQQRSSGFLRRLIAAIW